MSGYGRKLDNKDVWRTGALIGNTKQKLIMVFFMVSGASSMKDNQSARQHGMAMNGHTVDGAIFNAT